MIFNKTLEESKSEKWEELPSAIQKEWNKCASKNERLIILLRGFSKSKKCFMCKFKFPEGILNKNPYKIIPLLQMFKSDFLFHLKTTHGIDPDMFKMILLKNEFVKEKYGE